MSNLVKGTRQPQPQGRAAVNGAVEIDIETGVGTTTVFAWEGPVEEVAGILTPAFQLQYQRINYRQNPDNVTATIRATSSGFGVPPDPDDVLVDDWELLGSGDQPDLRHHPKFQALSSNDKAVIEKWLQDPDFALTSSPPFVPGSDGDQLLSLMRNGKDHFIRDYSILRRTRTVTNPTTVNVGMANISRRHTFAQLPAITNAGVALAVGNLNSAGPPFTVNTTLEEWSWLKIRPTLSGAAGGLAQIVEEYWLYVWAKIVYDAAS